MWTFEYERRRLEQEEIRDFAIATIGLILTFTFYNIQDLFESPRVGLLTITFILLGVLTGFILHELAHRLTARALGYIAFFRAWKLGIVISIFSGLVGGLLNIPFIIAAPGAVYVIPRSPFMMYTRKDELLIASAGPITNLIIAGVSLAIATLGKMTILRYFAIVAYINAFLAFFNLLPLPMLDGLKVLRSSLLVWMVLFGVSVLMLGAVHRLV